MDKTFLGVVALCGLLGLGLAGMAMANGALAGGEESIMVSPSTIVLAKVDTVTVHTNIAATAVEAGSLDLDNVAPISVYADSLGHVVAKFRVADLNLEPGSVTLTLSGDYKDGGGFSASDTVTVK